MATAKPAYEKRPYQQACLRSLKTAFTGGAGFALFVLATGLGKTYVAVQFLDWLLRKLRGTPAARPRVLVLCHQKPILRQLLKTFAGLLGGGRTYALYRPKHGDRTIPDVDVLFSTFQAMSRRKALFGRTYFDVVLVDEGHHARADSYEATIRYFQVRFRYAMTATPNRLDLRDIRSLFGPEVYSKPLAVALAENLLPRVVYKYFLESKGRTASAAVEGRRPRRQLLDKRFFSARGTPARDEKIADSIVAEMRALADPRALVFCQSIAACDRMTTYLVERGVRAAAVHSKVGDDEQEARLDALAAGQLEAIVARDVLNEGKDIPALNLVAIVRSTASRTIFEQQIGRGLRPGKEELVVLDFVANCDRIQYLADMVAAVRAAGPGGKRAGGGGGGNVEGVPVCTLSGPTEDLPFEVRPGEVEFEVVYKDLLEVLGRTSAWTPESGAEALRAEAALLGKATLVTADILTGCNAGRCPSLTWACNHLAPRTGGMAEVLETLGLEPNRWTLESGKAALRDVAKRLGKNTLTTLDIRAASKKGECPGTEWVQEKLAPQSGRMREALAALGLEEGRWTVASAVKALRSLARRLGQQTVMTRDLDVEGTNGVCPSTHWIREHLAPETGSWEEAMRTAGLETSRWTLESGKAALSTLAKRLGKKTLAEVDIEAGSAAGDCPSTAWVRRNIGSLSELREALGLEEPARWTVESAKRALRALARRTGGKALGFQHIAAGSKNKECPSYGWVIKNLTPNGGGLTELRAALGLDAE